MMKQRDLWSEVFQRSGSQIDPIKFLSTQYTIAKKSDSLSAAFCDGALFVELFDSLQHGDKEHREWLRDEIIEFINLNGCCMVPLTKEMFTIRKKNAV